MDWAVVESAALKAEAEEGQHGRRVVRVLFSATGVTALWHGLFGNAPVEFGPEGFVLSDGEVITL